MFLTSLSYLAGFIMAVSLMNGKWFWALILTVIVLILDLGRSKNVG